MSPSAKDSVPDAVQEGEPVSETALLRNPRWAEGRSEAEKKKTNKKRARTKRREKGGSSPPFSLPRSPSVSAPACLPAGRSTGRPVYRSRLASHSGKALSGWSDSRARRERRSRLRSGVLRRASSPRFARRRSSWRRSRDSNTGAQSAGLPRTASGSPDT